MLVDSHCHLDFPEFQEDFNGVLERARDRDVGMLLSISTHLSTFSAVRALAEKYPQVYCTVGVHPHEAAVEKPCDRDILMQLAEHPKVIGFGETGLDFYYEHSPRDEQVQTYIEHIHAAQTMGLPLIVHSREADEETVDVLKQENNGNLTGVIHCFSGGMDLAKRSLDLGFYISISGIVTFKKATELQEIVKYIPLESLLVETDAPFLAPVPMRGKRNEPSYVKYTAEFIADLKGEPYEKVAAQTTENFFKLFSKADPKQGVLS